MNFSHDSPTLCCALNLEPPTYAAEMMTGHTLDCNVCLQCLQDI